MLASAGNGAGPVITAAAGYQGAQTIATAPAPAPSTLYPGTVILTTTEDTGPDASGNYVTGRTITFQIATGDVGTVWVPLAGLTTASVAAAINAYAEALAAIWILNNPGT
jgi:hypothetical protein